MTTHEALVEWAEMISEFSGRWVELMRSDSWRDLPPHVATKIVNATKAFADAGSAIRESADADLSEYFD